MFKDKASDLFDELTVVQAAWDDPDPERSALRAFYDAAEGGGWTHRENWCSDKPLGEWYGVETDAEGTSRPCGLRRTTSREPCRGRSQNSRSCGIWI